MHPQIAPVLIAALLVAGCGGAQQAAPSDQPSAKVSADSGESPAADGNGRMTVTYEDAHTPEAENGRALLQDNTVLEDLADDINQSLALPHDVALIGAQCDEANAYWDRAASSVTICYEDADLAEYIFAEAGDPDPIASAVNSEYATFYHEVGHMVISLYNLPVTGREEDVADQLAAYVLLAEGEDGTIDPVSVQAVKDYARTFGAAGAERTELDNDDFADVHSLDETRNINLQCWIYGADPEGNADLVGGELPERRADGCSEEWAQLQNAWATLLDPHFK
ncbi:DUF4344 domain-containing metallopeptidase [Mycobacterium sp. ITM-2016-00317]|uniref:DUF4344 domain-containing metallopeptidase n=1 Tax=Mycobacterium sp. ITM-2016-00317 TaxID=2099694 RepID=UPI00287F89CB|nr:DUF4344 domain-containing metallopeptidase [Mycobacterium sp. ITM-2016-00317]WNG88593.1 DUF4344 domain-containing metallopeptidase [Mycobacterium sp. ITM-2016-00317]